MISTAIFFLIAILVLGGIFWVVVYSGRRGEQHRQRTTIKPPEVRGEERSG